MQRLRLFSPLRRPLTLRARLALWAALATGLATVLVAAGLFFAVDRYLLTSQQGSLLSAVSALQDRVERVAAQAAQPFGIGVLVLDGSDLASLTAEDDQTRSLQLRLVTPQGGRLQAVSTPGFPRGIPLNLPAGLYWRGDQLLSVRPLRQGTALLVVASDARALSQARRAFVRALAWLLPAALLLSLLVGWAVAGRLLRPVRTLERAAREIGDGGDLRRALPGSGEGDELARLALTLEQSYGRLADAREREQGFLRAAAHDLRSPLAAVQARVEGTLSRERDPERYRHDLREVGRDLGRLSALTNHLLLLSRDASALGQSPVPLRDLAAEAVDRARELAPEADIDLAAPTPVGVMGDRVLLGQAIWNLTVNAIRHAPGATVTVTVASLERGGTQVTVQDDGPGVPAEELARLGEAFYRPDTSRHGEGSGLGLALARRAAALHGGELILHSAPGQGFTAVLRLPVPVLPSHSATLSGNEPS
ncbi:HAMP domain-containing sensor histidine kinase [Deinococcus sp. Leaf326]|uniref:sensor histidine kinase n=1 Tax=Deinococcus sp. Leaf326 TaxID=1736338 RepID=UPI000A5F6096|nr:HAMP domain-containing sensor histidine kinase [Deinococcus sp. Leaf326]